MKIIPFTLSQSHSEKYNRLKITDEQIIRGILEYGGSALESAYKTYFQSIRKMVYTFNNTSLNPEDIFQEGLTRAVINIREGRFRGESALLTYLNSICRNICLKELARKQHGSIEGKDFPQETAHDRFDLLPRILEVRNRLDEKCRLIIDLRFNILEVNPDLKRPAREQCPSFEEIAERLSLSPDNARQRFKRCLDKLREYVMNDHVIAEHFVL